jgi:hypothetical protein
VDSTPVVDTPIAPGFSLSVPQASPSTSSVEPAVVEVKKDEPKGPAETALAADPGVVQPNIVASPSFGVVPPGAGPVLISYAAPISAVGPPGYEKMFNFSAAGSVDEPAPRRPGRRRKSAQTIEEKDGGESTVGTEKPGPDTSTTEDQEDNSLPVTPVLTTATESTADQNSSVGKTRENPLSSVSMQSMEVRSGGRGRGRGVGRPRKTPPSERRTRAAFSTAAIERRTRLAQQSEAPKRRGRSGAVSPVNPALSVSPVATPVIQSPGTSVTSGGGQATELVVTKNPEVAVSETTVVASSREAKVAESEVHKKSELPVSELVNFLASGVAHIAESIVDKRSELPVSEAGPSVTLTGAHVAEAVRQKSKLPVSEPAASLTGEAHTTESPVDKNSELPVSEPTASVTSGGAQLTEPVVDKNSELTAANEPSVSSEGARTEESVVDKESKLPVSVPAAPATSSGTQATESLVKKAEHKPAVSSISDVAKIIDSVVDHTPELVVGEQVSSLSSGEMLGKESCVDKKCEAYVGETSNDMVKPSRSEAEVQELALANQECKFTEKPKEPVLQEKSVVSPQAESQDEKPKPVDIPSNSGSANPVFDDVGNYMVGRDSVGKNAHGTGSEEMAVQDAMKIDSNEVEVQEQIFTGSRDISNETVIDQEKKVEIDLQVTGKEIVQEPVKNGSLETSNDVVLAPEKMEAESEKYEAVSDQTSKGPVMVPEGIETSTRETSIEVAAASENIESGSDKTNNEALTALDRVIDGSHQTDTEPVTVQDANIRVSDKADSDTSDVPEKIVPDSKDTENQNVAIQEENDGQSHRNEIEEVNLVEKVILEPKETNSRIETAECETKSSHECSIGAASSLNEVSTDSQGLDAVAAVTEDQIEDGSDKTDSEKVMAAEQIKPSSAETNNETTSIQEKMEIDPPETIVVTSAQVITEPSTMDTDSVMLTCKMQLETGSCDNEVDMLAGQEEILTGPIDMNSKTAACHKEMDAGYSVIGAVVMVGEEKNETPVDTNIEGAAAEEEIEMAPTDTISKMASPEGRCEKDPTDTDSEMADAQEFFDTDSGMADVQEKNEMVALDTACEMTVTQEKTEAGPVDTDTKMVGTEEKIEIGPVHTEAETVTGQEKIEIAPSQSTLVDEAVSDDIEVLKIVGTNAVSDEKDIFGPTAVSSELTSVDEAVSDKTEAVENVGTNAISDQEDISGPTAVGSALTPVDAAVSDRTETLENVGIFAISDEKISGLTAIGSADTAVDEAVFDQSEALENIGTNAISVERNTSGPTAIDLVAEACVASSECKGGNDNSEVELDGNDNSNNVMPCAPGSSASQSDKGTVIVQPKQTESFCHSVASDSAEPVEKGKGKLEVVSEAVDVQMKQTEISCDAVASDSVQTTEKEEGDFNNVDEGKGDRLQGTGVTGQEETMDGFSKEMATGTQKADLPTEDPTIGAAADEGNSNTMQENTGCSSSGAHKDATSGVAKVPEIDGDKSNAD